MSTHNPQQVERGGDYREKVGREARARVDQEREGILGFRIAKSAIHPPNASLNTLGILPLLEHPPPNLNGLNYP